MLFTAALEAGNYPEANRLIDIMSSFEEIRSQEQNGTNVTAVKAALQLMGEDCGPTRPPSAWPLTEKQMTELQRLLASWNLVSPQAKAKANRKAACQQNPNYLKVGGYEA